MGMLDGKTVLVSGVGLKRGIGTAVARKVISQGGKPVITCHPTLVGKTEGLFEGEDLCVVPCDFSQEEDIARMCKTLSGNGLQLDGFLHSVASLPNSVLAKGRRLVDLTTEEILEPLKLNALSFLWMARHLLGNGGESRRILSAEAVGVAMTFRLGSQKVVDTYWPMAPSKALLEVLALYLAQDLGRDGIRIHILDAGPIDTVAARGVPNFMALYRSVSDVVPLGQNTTAEGVANAIAFLLSPDAKDVGLILSVDSGLGMRGIIPVPDTR
jgi:enoyl-[acyl-carrier protein] reductase I